MANSHSSYITENLLSAGGFLLLQSEKYRIVRRYVAKNARFFRKFKIFDKKMRKKGKFFLQIWIFFCIFVAIFDRYV